MRRTSNSLERRTLVAGTGLATLLAIFMMTPTAFGDTASEQTTPSTNPPVSTVSEQVGGNYDVVINVKMSDFAFTPDTLRIPAGQTVKLVLENVGVVAHEFMAGRDVASDESAFSEDLFARVDVEMGVGKGMDDMNHEGMGMDMDDMNHEGMEGMKEGHRPGQEAEDHEHAEKAEVHEHGGDDHGTMLLLEGKATGSMRFTLPESKRGTWAIGCFLPGHYQAGMKGILIVE
ncbi:MAG: hypothetical protein BMS9Abin05_2465 [Rhodothermia bacterium]|nr:MAG: hypothetical protein BMS9Abin05_2465 [Rhodothermia bacterium]